MSGSPFRGKGAAWPVGCCKDGSVSALARFEQTSPVPYAAVLYSFLTRGRCTAPKVPVMRGTPCHYRVRPVVTGLPSAPRCRRHHTCRRSGGCPSRTLPVALRAARPTGARHSRTQPRAGLGSPFRVLRVMRAPHPPLRPPSLHAMADGAHCPVFSLGCRDGTCR